MSAADYCVRDACPMVVGMQAVLPFGTERILTRFFYQALTAGQPVAEALRLARLAIAGDEHAGGSLLNWAVPCLFVGGSEPGPLADPDAKAAPPARERRVALRLGVRQGELRFISRLAEVRTAVDILSGRSDARLLLVLGPSSTGKTSPLDRALEELDPNRPSCSSTPHDCSRQRTRSASSLDSSPRWSREAGAGRRRRDVWIRQIGGTGCSRI